MCKSTQPQRDSGAITSDVVPVQNLPLQSVLSALQVKNTFLNVSAQSGCPGFTRTRKRATSAPVRERSGSDTESVSTSEPSSDNVSDVDYDSDATSDVGHGRITGLEVLTLPHAMEVAESWPATPDVSPRANSDAIVPTDAVFKLIGCLSNMFEIMEAHDVDALICLARACLPSHVPFSVSTPLWSNEFVGDDAVDGFLHHFVQAFPDIRVSLDDVIHPQQQGEPIRWRATCTGTMQLPFLGMLPVGTRVQFIWETTQLKDADGKAALLNWKFNPVSPSPSVQYAGMLQFYVPAQPVTNSPFKHAQSRGAQSSQQADDSAASLLLQAERAKLAAASLRALGALEARESRHTNKGTDTKKSSFLKSTKAASAREEEPVLDSSQEKSTTVILRNIPLEYTRQMFLDLLNAKGFAGKFDFVYMPRDFQRSFGLGYCFVNMVTPADAHQVHSSFHGFNQWDIPSQKVCEVGWSSRQQGLTEQIKRYRNSPVMHDSVPDEYKPCVFRHGVRVAFPAPTQVLKRPRGLGAIGEC